ncbi:MAG: FAD-dependent oxidoreductase [Spirochaetia bacterium]|jgi:3-phenylpropionate/trans-cinnamate dioxygenase ferredoxin reductase subunit
MSDEGWQKVCRQDDLKEGALTLVKSGEDSVCVVRLEGAVLAVGNKCPHYECKLNEGMLIGSELTCRCHDARFDIRTGKVLSAPALNDLTVYPVRLEGGDVLLGAAVKPRFPKPPGTDPRTFLIVGGGAAGNSAAETLRREGFAGRIVMVTLEADQPYDRPNLSKEFMSGDAKPEWMPLRSEKFYANQNIEVLTGTKVTSIDPRKKSVSLSVGHSLSYDMALLATGATPRKLSVPGADGKGCFQLRSFADARLILEAAGSARKAALIGAGFIGMELASSLRKRGLAVTVITPETQPFARVVGDKVAAYMRSRHEKDGVVFCLGAGVAGISGGVVSLSDGRKVEADFVVFGIGVQPAVDYLAGTDLVENGAVPVSPQLRTKYADLFAAGDIAVVPDPLTGAGTRIEHWVVAERQGEHAARAMLGSSAPYEEVPFFWTRQTGVSLKYVGFAPQWDEIAYRGSVDSGKFLAGYYRGGTLRAAASMGMPVEIAAVKVMIGKKRPLPPIRLADESVDLVALARA